MYSYGGYRSAEEVDAWKERCPIKQLGERLVKDGVAAKTELEKIRSEVDVQIATAIEFATNSPEPDPSELMKNLFEV